MEEGLLNKSHSHRKTKTKRHNQKGTTKNVDQEGTEITNPSFLLTYRFLLVLPIHQTQVGNQLISPELHSVGVSFSGPIQCRKGILDSVGEGEPARESSTPWHIAYFK